MFLAEYGVSEKEALEMYNHFRKMKKSYRLMIVKLIESGATLSQIKEKLNSYEIRSILDKSIRDEI